MLLPSHTGTFLSQSIVCLPESAALTGQTVIRNNDKTSSKGPSAQVKRTYSIQQFGHDDASCVIQRHLPFLLADDGEPSEHTKDKDSKTTSTFCLLVNLRFLYH